MSRLEGKVAVITGGASGIGRRAAERFVEEGARVFIADINQEAINATVAAIGHNQADGLTVDVRDEAAVQKMVEETVRRFGRVDIGLNCAGVGTFSPIHQHPLEEWQRIIDINLTGAFLSIKHESARMVAQGRGGSIITIASLNARQAAEGMAAYCSAKAGVAMLTQVSALELGRHGIRVNAIAPGLIETPLSAGLHETPAIRDAFLNETPMGRTGTTTDIADLCVYLASDESAYMTGQTLSIDGGESLKKYPELFTLFGAMQPPEA
jgi:NAD(P)-dependent dehydrogenase (short-subunit alcohol dehydrogenase family)